jgi:hypothetical protein
VTSQEEYYEYFVCYYEKSAGDFARMIYDTLTNKAIAVEVTDTKMEEMDHSTRTDIMAVEMEKVDKAYYEGFIDGCTSVEGNTREVCESATDAS